MSIKEYEIDIEGALLYMHIKYKGPIQSVLWVGWSADI